MRPVGSTALLTAIAMIAFAGNSVLCRLALADGAIDPASFTAIRLVAGAITLVALVLLRGRRTEMPVSAGSWGSSMTLVAYAICFSWAYVRLDAATGALILFGSVQCTMIVAGLVTGERPSAAESIGWLFAVSGMVALLLPGASAPSLQGSALMITAGIGWGLYSLYGRGEKRPLLSTAGNFVRALPLLLPVVALALFATPVAAPSATGVLVAVLSGSVTTGLGYIAWYAALPSLTSLQAALVQLSVPAIAAAGGVALLAEVPGLRVITCGIVILGGICYATLRHVKPAKPGDLP